MGSHLNGISDISLDGYSRSVRWKKLKGYLREMARTDDFIGDRLASLREEVEQIREDNLKLSEMLQTLSDLSGEEEQREISLTLNDTGYEVVVDTAMNPSPLSLVEAKVGMGVSCNLVEELKKLPGIGDTTAKRIVEYFQGSEQDKTQQLALLLSEIHRDKEHQQSLPLEREGE
ncbi:hypothetical protein [Berryella intestinalis]|nr:hypothetical protein [Berryella intestinalis]